MVKKWLLLVLICGFLVHGCQLPSNKATIANDPHSFAKPNEAKATHLLWEGSVDFASKSISAIASWTLELAEGADSVVFDTYGLFIDSVFIDDKQTAKWHLAKYDSILGSALVVKVSSVNRLVHIHYRTSPQAKGLQWLSAEQTSDKTHPFLFSQGQAILTRSWLPCQDSPALRFSFDAKVRVPPGLMAVMSAPNNLNQNPDGQYSFSNQTPVPSYLFSLAVGGLSYRAFDERSGIFAEKSTLDAAWQEFANLPPMIKAAESMYGKMPWQRLDLLVLPPSFPFGGTENPNIMFVAPTLIAGDRSLTNLVAHELAHAWSDQLLRFAGWEHFWLNEFFTNYIERRIISAIEGLSYTVMMQSLSNWELERQLTLANKAHDDMLIVPQLMDKDPDRALAPVRYLKIAAMMMQLERQLGNKALDTWVKKNINNGLPDCHDTETFVEKHKKSLFSNAGIDNQTLEAWLFSSELPPSYQKSVSVRFTNVEAVASLWLQGENIDFLPTGAWSVHEWMYFLKVINQQALPANRVHELDLKIGLSNSGNAELLAVWFDFALQQNYLDVLPAVENYIAKTGRRKLLLVVYGALCRNPLTRSFAQTCFKKYGDLYHDVVRKSIEGLILQ